MLSLPHAAVGAAIATIVPHPAVSLPLSLLSHFLTDYLPHWNPHLDTELRTRGRLSPATQALAIADFFAALFFAVFLSLRSPVPLQSVNLFLCPLAAILPDLAEAPHYFMGIRLPLVDKLIHHQRRHQFHISPLPGLLTQALVLLLSLTIIF